MRPVARNFSAPSQVSPLDTASEQGTHKPSKSIDKLPALISTSGLVSRYTPEEYLKLSTFDPNRNLLNNFLVLGELPKANSDEMFELIEELAMGLNQMDLARYAIQASGTDMMTYHCETEEAGMKLGELLENSPSVTKLNLSFGSQTVGSASQICKNSYLQEIQLSCNKDDAPPSFADIFYSLSKKTNLTTLSLEGFSFSASDCQDDSSSKNSSGIGKVIEANSGLTEVKFSGKLIDGDVNSHFISLKNLPHLQKLIIEKGVVINNSTNDWAEIISKCQCLQNLQIDGFFSGSLTGDFLINCIQDQTTLQKLSVCRVSLKQSSPEGSKESFDTLRRTLVEHPSLRFLNLSSGELDDKFIADLFSGPPDNWTLTDINLSDNHCGKAAAFSISKFLASSPRLQSLNLSSSYIDAESASIIASGLEKNHCLRRLEIIDITHDIDDEAVKKIKEKKIEPILISNVRSEMRALEEKWSLAFTGTQRIPYLELPSELGALLAQKVLEIKRATDPQKAAVETDAVMQEMVLSMNNQAQQTQANQQQIPAFFPVTDSKAEDQNTSARSAE